ncbi:MAG: hypothetical protein IKP88_15360 [Lachnospiraceae bacterium]|nr:hypothetical protein [Lachnospiraceae bacterium]
MKGKIIAALSIVLFLVAIATGVKVYAGVGETVRVSTEKQLKAAMKNADVGTIIFRTNAYINVTIKSAKGSDEKFLIIDAPYASFTNKAVFAEINIMNAKSYIESVSGNDIIITGELKGYQDYVSGLMYSKIDGFTVSKKKQVESLTIYDDEFITPKFTLRKGAKIKNLALVYDDGNPPVASTYDSSKKQLALNYTNIYGAEESLQVKLDKSGRIKKIKCKSSNDYFDYEYTFTYDSNGNVIKMTGENVDNGEFKYDYTYSPEGLAVKSECSGAYTEVWSYYYDDKGQLTECFNGNGSSSEATTVYSYEYDEKGRLTCDKYSNSVSESSFEHIYTYNSKGFQIKEEFTTSYSISYVIIHKYNKAGDLIQFTITSDGESTTEKFKYDELGNLI